MKTNTLFFLLALVFSLTTNAQITKNNWLVGGDIAFSYSKSKADTGSETFTMRGSPNVGYFFFDKVAFGTKVNYTLSRAKFDSGTSKFDRLLISPFARYYFLDADKMVNPFIESSYRFSLVNENNSKEFSAKGGVAIFLNSSVALEISLNYLNSITNNSFVGDHKFLLGFGIQVHLEREK